MPLSPAGRNSKPKLKRRAAYGVRSLPVDPLDGMAGEIGTHGFIDGSEKGVLTQAREHLEAFELVLDRILHLGEAQLDSSVVQRVVELADRVGRGDVDARDRLRRDHEPADGRRRAAPQRPGRAR